MHHHDPTREQRIQDEIIVDSDDDQDVEMSWYYYFADNLEFPFEAAVQLKTRTGKTIQVVDVVEVDPNGDKAGSLRLGVIEAGIDRIQFIDPADIITVTTTAENLQILNDWLYNEQKPLLTE